MIRLLPYYERDDGKEMLDRFLRMVAEVVPFFREDVLDDTSLDKLGEPRRRNDTYRDFVKQQLTIEDKKDPIDRKKIDARVAEKLIKDYSLSLHRFLYEGCIGDGHVNKEKLRKLLTVRLHQGKVPDELCFNDCSDGKLLLAHVFRYDALSRHSDLYDYVKSIGSEVCPYCNRMFTTTVTAKTHRARPQLDHFRNKEKYPYLALSINNLVPSCGVCNLLKHNNDRDLVYPYEERMGNDCTFRTTIPDQHITAVLTGAKVAPKHFKLTLEVDPPGSDPQQKERVDRLRNSIEELALEQLYVSHKGYVADLYFQRYILTDELVQDRWNQFKDNGLFNSAEEVRDALLATYMQEERWGERPLSKLTHDIREEIEKLYAQIHP